MTTSIGIDVGSGVIKTALFRVEEGKTEWVSRWDARIRQRDPYKLVEESIEFVLDQAGLKRSDVHYVATTGEGENIKNATGHFYTMTTHARGALYLNSDENQGYSVNDFILNLSRLDEKIIYDSLSRHASGIYFLGLPTKMEELEHITDISLKSVLATLRRYFDQVIIDCASDLGPVTLACLDESDDIMLIAEPSLSAMRAVKIAYDTCRRLGYAHKSLRLILNRESSLSDELTGELIEALDLHFAGRVENNYLAFLHALQDGKMLHDYSPGCLADQQIKAIANMIVLDAEMVAVDRQRVKVSATPLDWLRKALSRVFSAGTSLAGARQ